MVKQRELILFVLLFFLGLLFAYIYGHIDKAKKDIFDRIEKNQMEQISYVIKNIERDILDSFEIKTPEDLRHLFSNSGTREDYEHLISLMMTSDVKYAYILYKDEKDRFRFLLDASKTDKANFYQKFDVSDSKYNTIYRIKKPQIIKQHDMENLYLTYLYPIISHDTVVGLFSIDVTTNIQKIILESIKPLETFFIILIIFILLLMLLTIMQIYHYIVTRKKIFTDPLTNTFNRNYLQEISSMINLSHYSIAMIDLDKFKIINDTYGHKAGDYVLTQTTKIFKKSLRDSDILIRYGGEEFLLLVNNRDKDSSAFRVCERIKENVSKEHFVYDHHEIQVRVSIGLHMHPALEKNMQEAIKIADKMLYLAKKNGRDRIICYDEKSLNDSNSLHKDISFVKHALEDDRIVCHYQPIYCKNSKEIFKYEALVRIVDKDNTIVPPMQFLPQIQHTNIHYKLTQRVLMIIFNKFKDNKELVSINMNFSDLIHPDIENTIVETLTNNQDLASRITFEILESDEIDNIELFKEKIKLIHSLKSKVSIDDFGSGYSNFKTTIDIEANYLKIDGSLIKNIDTNEKDFKVVESIIHFAQQAGMHTVAEYVHSKEVFEKLLELNLDYMQGYYISKPHAELVQKEDLFKKVV